MIIGYLSLVIVHMYTIRFMPYRKELGAIMSRQTPGHSLRSQDGRYQFILDESCEFLGGAGEGSTAGTDLPCGT